jgi:glycosyltransferase involved in cell wall biosynthesis
MGQVMEQKQVKVGIVMATYNPNFSYFKEQISSIKDQIYPFWECTISDDSSDHETQKKIKEYISDDPRFSYVRSENPRGIFQNFENGVRNVRPEARFLCFCDQDDVWRKDKLDILIKLIRQRPEIMLVHSDAIIIDENGKEICSSLWKYERRNVKNTSYFDLIVRNHVTGCTVLTRRSVVESALPFPDQRTDCTYYHDHWIALNAALMGEVAFCPEKLVRYRRHRGNVVGPTARDTFKLAFHPGQLISEGCRQWKFTKHLKGQIVDHIISHSLKPKPKLDLKKTLLRDRNIIRKIGSYAVSDFIRLAKLSLILSGGIVCRLKSDSKL